MARAICRGGLRSRRAPVEIPENSRQTRDRLTPILEMRLKEGFRRRPPPPIPVSTLSDRRASFRPACRIMPTAVATVPQTFVELVRAVKATMIEGQRAVEHAKVRTYWETGRLIKEYVLLFKDRADYGASTIP